MNFWKGVVRGGNCFSAQTIRRQNNTKNIVSTELPRESHTFVPQRNGFKPGDKAPFAYNDVYQYPKDFQPWNYNYKGSGVTLALFVALSFSLVSYEVSYANRTGRLERQERSASYQL